MKKNKLSKKYYTQPTTLNTDNKKELNFALDRFLNLLQFGYTEENFSNMARCVNVIKRHINLNDAKQLESFWRDVYTDFYEEEKINTFVQKLKTVY